MRTERAGPDPRGVVRIGVLSDPAGDEDVTAPIRTLARAFEQTVR